MQSNLALSLALFVPTDIVVQMFTCISWKNALEEFFLRCSHAICVSIGKETITHCRVKSHVWWSYTTWTLFTQLTESPPVPQQSWGLLILSSVEHSSRRQMWKCWIFWDLVYLIPEMLDWPTRGEEEQMKLSFLVFGSLAASLHCWSQVSPTKSTHYIMGHLKAVREITVCLLKILPLPWSSFDVWFYSWQPCHRPCHPGWRWRLQCTQFRSKCRHASANHPWPPNTLLRLPFYHQSPARP